MILKVDEVADELGVSVPAVYKMVERGQIKPAIRGAKPLRFHLHDVWEAGVRRTSKATHARLDALANRMVA